MKKRIDVYLTENNLVPSREKAKALIMAGCVYVNNQKTDKPGTEVKDTDIVELRGDKLKYVSRGGLKLEKAMEHFDLKSLDGAVCMDIGASTGGFTDCMLQNGAIRVYAVDVGYGQLAWELRVNEKVVNLERTNIRYVTDEQVPDKLDFASVDVSFISLKLVLPVAYNLLKEDGEMVCLIKPQFEAGRENVGKKGVVRDPQVHKQVIEAVVEFVKEIGFVPINLDYSPIKGPEGNIEYLIHLGKNSLKGELDTDAPQRVVEASHKELDLR